MNPKDRIDASKLPKHLAVIMDGNGRWAKKQGFFRSFGHENGTKAVREIVEACAELPIPYLTLFAFSTENWNRPKAEVETLMKLLVSSLKKEIEHIESYIEIQKLRYDETDEVLINFEKRGDWQSKQIAPMLLLPFVENAFKHGVSIHGSSVIAIFLETTAASLLFKVRNKIRNEKKSIHDVSGIGLENVKRRLDLIYPNQYDLAIRTEKDHYEVALIISS